MRTYAYGCWADGSFGWQHVRERLSSLIREFDDDLADELLKEMSDDGSEEDDALDLLQANTSTPGVWEFVDGDLMFSRLVSENSGV